MNTILVVEDEEINYLYIQEVLRDYNLEIKHAKFVREVEELIASGETFDLILMDIKLPDGNGFDLTKKLKRQFPTLPIIAQTAYAMSNDKQRSIEAGCDDYISKPIVRQKLIDILNDQIKL